MDIIVKKSNNDLKDNNITMANQLIRASHKLNLNEKRLISACVSLIDSSREITDEEYKSTCYRLYAIDFGKLFHIDEKHTYEYLKAASDSLIEKVGRYKDKKGYVKFNWIDYAKYREGEGYIELAFGSVIKPFLHNLKREFTIYKLRNACNFSSIYTWRIYELLQSYKLKYLHMKLSTEMTNKHRTNFIAKLNKIHNGMGLIELKKRDEKIIEGRKLPNVFKISLDDLRESLDIPDSYKWNDIKKRAINTAIKELYKTLKIDIKLKTYNQRGSKAIKSISLEWSGNIQSDWVEDIERDKIYNN